MLLGAVVWLFLFSVTIQQGHGAKFTEDQIKAVYLFNFAEFIRWPDSAFSDHPKAFYYCALDEESPVIRILKKAIKGETAGGRKLLLRHVNNLEDLKSCQLLFFQADELEKLTGLLPGMAGKNILTVGDTEGFVERGGMIGITQQNRHLHPVINVQRLNQAGLKASAKLLRLSSVVDGVD
jgi:hypothetical protein